MPTKIWKIKNQNTKNAVITKNPRRQNDENGKNVPKPKNVKNTFFPSSSNVNLSNLKNFGIFNTNDIPNNYHGISFFATIQKFRFDKTLKSDGITNKTFSKYAIMLIELSIPVFWIRAILRIIFERSENEHYYVKNPQKNYIISKT